MKWKECDADLWNDAESKPLRGVFAAITIGGTAAWLWAVCGTSRPIEATIQMEQLAARAEQARSIHPDTARDLARMLALPQYDCAQAACSADLQARNSAARARLEALIARKTRTAAFAASSEPVIATGSGQLAAPR